MRVIFHEDFYQVYTSDPAASMGRMEAIVKVIEPHVEFLKAESAHEEDIERVHTKSQLLKAMKGHILDEGMLMGKYKR